MMLLLGGQGSLENEGSFKSQTLYVVHFNRYSADLGSPSEEGESGSRHMFFVLFIGRKQSTSLFTVRMFPTGLEGSGGSTGVCLTWARDLS